MLTVILSFLKSHVQVTLIVSGVLAVLATVSLQHLEIKHFAAKLGECRAESVTLKEANAALVASIQRQDAAIATIQAQGHDRQIAASKALAQAKTDALRHDAVARAIEAQAASGDECSQMRTLLESFRLRAK